jgi:hypothetical protein
MHCLTAANRLCAGMQASAAGSGTRRDSTLSNPDEKHFLNKV